MSNDITLTPSEGEKVRKSVESLKQKQHKKLCRSCGEEIQFKEVGDKYIPHDLDDSPHWRTCPFVSRTQKIVGLEILKKIGLYYALNEPDLDLEQTFNLTSKEGKVYRAVLEKLVNGLDKPEEPQVIEGDLSFKPVPTDPVGDPDEERAPSEDLIKETSPEELVTKEG